MICGNYKLDTQHLDYSIMMVFGLIVKSLISIFLLMCLICDSSGDQAGIAYLKLADCHLKANSLANTYMIMDECMDHVATAF